MSPDKKEPTFDELEEALAADFAENASREELDLELARLGIDANAIASRARAIAADRGLAGASSPDSWQERARQRLAAARDKVRTTAKAYAQMTRDELLARLEEIRNHPGLAQPVTAAFRKRSPQEASDDELRAILADIDSLIEIVTQADESSDE